MSGSTRKGVADSSQTVGTSAVQAIAANPQREFLMIQNASSVNNAGFTLNGTTPVIGNAGTFTLAPGQGFVFDKCVPTGAVTVIGAAANTPVSINSFE